MERAGGMVGRLMEGGWCREDMLGFPKDAPGGQITGVGRRREGSRRKRSSFGKEERRLRLRLFTYLVLVYQFVMRKNVCVGNFFKIF